MHPHHNPIARRIDAMRKVWQSKVKDETMLVRWMLKAEETRMYEGFCRLEASPFGELPELVIFFYTSFEGAADFSRRIILEWIKEIENNVELKEKISNAGFDINGWDYQKYRPSGKVDCNQELIDMVNSFRRLLKNDNIPIVIALLPKQINSTAQFSYWLNQMMQLQLSRSMRLLLLDHIEINAWGKIFETYSDCSATLSCDLQLDKALREIATGGNRQDPHVQFRQCMFEMGDASQNNDQKQLHVWGKKAIEIGVRTANRQLLATAYITYAGMLFNFRVFQSVNELLDKGMEICKRAISAGDVPSKPLLLQFFGFKAAAYQHQGETSEAYNWFVKQGRSAQDFLLFVQGISAFHKAFLLAKYKKMPKEQVMALQMALLNTSQLSDDDLINSEYAYVAYEYDQLSLAGNQDVVENLLALSNKRMTESYGADWRAQVEILHRNFDKRHIKTLNSETVPV